MGWYADDESDDENEPLGDFEADEIAPGSKKKSKKQKSGKKSAKRKAGGGLAALGGGGPTSVKAVAKPKTYDPLHPTPPHFTPLSPHACTTLYLSCDDML